MNPIALSFSPFTPATPAQAFLSGILLNPSDPASAADPFAARVWTRENLVSSYGKTVLVKLPGLPAGATSLENKWVKILGQTQLNGKFLHNPFRDTSSLVTADPFDQVQTYIIISGMIMYQNDLGFDNARILARRLPVIVAPNAIPDTNAYMDPAAVAPAPFILLGTSLDSPYGEWHLASDQGIPGHEFGHLDLDCINPALTSWYARDGGAIHEGYGDTMIAFFFLDPEVGEDLPPNVGELIYGPDRGLRTVANFLKYQEGGTEVHDLGRVYGGFSWSMRLAITDLLRDPKSAAGLSTAILKNHGAHYATNRPGPADFIDAVVAGAKAYLEGSKLFSVPFGDVQNIIMAEARKREMLDSDKEKIGVRKEISLDILKVLTNPAHPFSFGPVEATRGTFGGRDFLQQFLNIGGAPVRLLGSGLIVFRDNDENPTAYSDSDVRTDPNINPTINVSREAAYAKALIIIQKRLEEHDAEIERLDRMPITSARDERGKNTEITMARIRRQAVRGTLEVLRASSPEDAELVVMPEGYDDGTRGNGTNDLYWYFGGGKNGVEAPFGRVYVNANTGEEGIAEMPMW